MEFRSTGWKLLIAIVVLALIALAWWMIFRGAMENPNPSPTPPPDANG